MLTQGTNHFSYTKVPLYFESIGRVMQVLFVLPQVFDQLVKFYIILVEIANFLRFHQKGLGLLYVRFKKRDIRKFYRFEKLRSWSWDRLGWRF